MQGPRPRRKQPGREASTYLSARIRWSTAARDLDVRALIELLDALCATHDVKHLREVLAGRVLASPEYVAELAAALARTPKPLRPSEHLWWMAGLLEDAEVPPDWWPRSTVEFGRIRDVLSRVESGQTQRNGHNGRSPGGYDGPAGEGGFEPPIA